MSEWQPIETAPKDGTEVLVTAFKYNKPPARFVSIAQFSEDGNCWQDQEPMPVHPPTHWMPLPAPPAE